MKKLKIIIADDHTTIRQGVKAVIESQKTWELCGEATDGRSAVELALKFKPDIAVLDITMPELNGLEATRVLTTKSPDTKVLILTMHDSESLAEEVLQAGARGYLLKSDAVELLPKAIETLAAGGSFLTPKIASLAGERQHKSDPQNSHAHRFRLTPREREIVKLLAEEKSNKEVAEALGLPISTVKTHRKNIFSKLQLHNISDLVRYAIRNNPTQD